MNTHDETEGRGFMYAYAVLVLMVIGLSAAQADGGLVFSKYRLAMADRFTTVMVALAAVILVHRTFFSKTIDPHITETTVRETFFGLRLEYIGLAWQGLYWLPWYVGKENQWQTWVHFSNTNAWLVSPAYILIWTGAGFTLAMTKRGLMGSHDRYWLWGWLSYIITCWIVGYQLADVFAMFGA